MVGVKKIFAPANEKAKTLTRQAGFGQISLVRLEYPQCIPTVEELRRFMEDGDPGTEAVRFLDHLCHPMALLVYLLGMPDTPLRTQPRWRRNGDVHVRLGPGGVAGVHLGWSVPGRA